MSFGFHLSFQLIHILQNNCEVCVHRPPPHADLPFTFAERAGSSPLSCRVTWETFYPPKSSRRLAGTARRPSAAWISPLNTLCINSRRVTWPEARPRLEQISSPQPLIGTQTDDVALTRWIIMIWKGFFSFIWIKPFVQCPYFCAATSHIIRRPQYQHHLI